MYYGGTRVSQMYANGASGATWNMADKKMTMNFGSLSMIDSGVGGAGYTFSKRLPICTKVVNNGNGTVTATNGTVLMSAMHGVLYVMSWPGAEDR